MDISALASIIGIALTITHNNAHAYKYQHVEGKKVCDFATVYILQKTDRKIYLKMHDKVHTMFVRPAAKGNEDIKRFETIDSSVVLLQTPQKALILDNVKMKPLYNECINSEV